MTEPTKLNEQLTAHAKTVAAQAPPLTEQQIHTLSTLIGGGVK